MEKQKNRPILLKVFMTKVPLLFNYLSNSVVPNHGSGEFLDSFFAVKYMCSVSIVYFTQNVFMNVY